MPKHLLIKFGGIGSAASALLMISGMVLYSDTAEQYEAAELLGHVSILLGLSMMLPPMFILRQRHGSLKFGPAFRIGMSLTGLLSVVLGLVAGLMFALMPSEMLAVYREQAVAEMTANGIDPASPEAQESLAIGLSPSVQGIVMAITVLLIGLAMSLVAGGILHVDSRRQTHATPE